MTNEDYDIFFFHRNDKITDLCRFTKVSSSVKRDILGATAVMKEARYYSYCEASIPCARELVSCNEAQTSKAKRIEV
jgi:hypothetical protein